MNIIKKLASKNNHVYGSRQPCIAFLGDSVTQGCFELYPTSESSLETVYEQEYSYPHYLKQRLADIFPAAATVIVNAGVSGDNATNALNRLDRDVLSFKPDLVVVCFGLNDCSSGEAGLQSFRYAMEKIVYECKTSGAEVIVMTPNELADRVSVHVRNEGYPFIVKCTEQVAFCGRSGILDKYVAVLKDVAKKYNVPVCDVNARWKKLKDYGVDVTELLANKANHPTRQLNKLFADALLLTMIDN